jgi:threonine aldolase
VGSLLLGKKDFIKKARRVRKVFGGGMRQAGFLAAAGVYALQNNVERLKEDHVRAKQIGCALQKKSFVKLVLPVETNIIIIELDVSISAPAFVAKMKEENIIPYAITPNRARFVVHLDITDEMIGKTIEMIDKM